MFPTNDLRYLLQKQTKNSDGPWQISEPLTLEDVTSEQHLGEKALQESHSYNAELQMWGFWPNYSSQPNQTGKERGNLEMPTSR